MSEITVHQIEIKEDSQAKLNAVAGIATKHVLFAAEFNAVVKAAKKAKIFAPGELCLFKAAPNEAETPEPGDYVFGFVEGQFVNAEYIGGDPLLLSSYGIDQPIEE